MRSPIIAALLIVGIYPDAGLAAESCAAGTLWEPYAGLCANVRDLRDEFLPGAPEPAESLSEMTKSMPVPGGLAVGTVYQQLQSLNSGRLHTKMIVHPGGLQPDGDLPLMYTTATSRVQHGLEVVGIYWREHVNLGRLGLWAWPCLPDYPCPDGDTVPGWQWITGFPNLQCNVTHGVDQGGHAQKLLYYANHTDKLDAESPPQWKSALYLWNYCDQAWDLTWEHIYREDKIDCSIAGSGCAWWGPGIETFGDNLYPQIAELGYEDSLLYHDGIWSELRAPETDFRDPAIWATNTPWQLFHLDPNRSFGVGNFLNENDPPVIDGQLPLEVAEDMALAITSDDLLVSDPDVDANFHASFDLSLFSGDNFTHEGNVVTPSTDFHGSLRVPATASDGFANSSIFEIQIDVHPVNDVPTIIGQQRLETWERSPLTIQVQNLIVDDPDNAASDLVIIIYDGSGFQHSENVVTPNFGVAGNLVVPIAIYDGELLSDEFPLNIFVKTRPKLKSGGGSIGPLFLLLLLLRIRRISTGQRSIICPGTIPEN
jgi:hypothetical protein